MQKIIWLGMVVLSLVGVNVQAKDNTYVGDNIVNPALKSSGYCYFDWYRPSNMKKDKQESRDYESVLLIDKMLLFY